MRLPTFLAGLLISNGLADLSVPFSGFDLTGVPNLPLEGPRFLSKTFIGEAREVTLTGLAEVNPERTIRFTECVAANVTAGAQLDTDGALIALADDVSPGLVTFTYSDFNSTPGGQTLDFGEISLTLQLLNAETLEKAEVQVSAVDRFGQSAVVFITEERQILRAPLFTFANPDFDPTQIRDLNVQVESTATLQAGEKIGLAGLSLGVGSGQTLISFDAEICFEPLGPDVAKLIVPIQSQLSTSRGTLDYEESAGYDTPAVANPGASYQPGFQVTISEDGTALPNQFEFIATRFSSPITGFQALDLTGGTLRLEMLDDFSAERMDTTITFRDSAGRQVVVREGFDQKDTLLTGGQIALLSAGFDISRIVGVEVRMIPNGEFNSGDVIGAQALTYYPRVLSAPEAVILAEVERADDDPRPATDLLGAPDLTVRFRGSSSRDDDGCVETYEWDFGDGSEPSFEVNPTHTFTQQGSFVVTLKVTDDDGLETFATPVKVEVLEGLNFGAPIGAPIVRADDGAVISLRRRPIHQGDLPFNFTVLPTADIASNLVSLPEGGVFDPSIDLNIEGSAAKYDFHWSPHASYPADTSGDVEIIGPGPGISTITGFAFASAQVTMDVFWRTENPLPDGSYGLVARRIAVGGTDNARTIYWTEIGSLGQPILVPDSGPVRDIKVAYREGFSAGDENYFPEIQPENERFVPSGFRPPGEGSIQQFLPERTFWYNSTLRRLQAYNREGRVLIEILGGVVDGETGRRRFLGVEVVDVIQEPVSTEVSVPLGESLYPWRPNNGSGDQEIYDSETFNRELTAENDPNGSLAIVEEDLALVTPVHVGIVNLVDPEVAFARHIIGDRVVYFAERPTTLNDDIKLFWNESGIANLQWPKYFNNYRFGWPEELSDYVVNIRPSDLGINDSTLPFSEPAQGYRLIRQDRSGGTLNSGKLEVTLNEGGVHRSLLKFETRNSQETTGLWYLRVESVNEQTLEDDVRDGPQRYRAFVRTEDEISAQVGSRIEAPGREDVSDTRILVAGFIDSSEGDAYSTDAYVNPFTAKEIKEANEGAIIPVNAEPMKQGRANDVLAVWWFQKVDPPAAYANRFESIYFPSYYDRYQLRWPSDGERIVLASNEGSGDLPADIGRGQIYRQNDPSLPGFNPNEEHAQILGGAAWALRTDLNKDNVSAPCVLIAYENGIDERPDMVALPVVAEAPEENLIFDYEVTAGSSVDGPMPLPILPNVPFRSPKRSANTEVDRVDLPEFSAAAHPGIGYYDNFTYEDRKGLKWLYRGPHRADSNPSFGMKFYYLTQPSFDFPDFNGIDRSPPIGTITPYLHAEEPDNSEITGESKTIVFRPKWPENVPTLTQGETLTEPRNNLPQIRGAASLQILYQQSLALDSNAEESSVVLHDPTREKLFYFEAEGSGTELTRIPASVATSPSIIGRVFFQNLAPHLAERFFFDPLKGAHGALVLQGQFVQEIDSDSYLLPNILTQDDFETLINLPRSDDEDFARWEDAIRKLSTQLETFVEDPALPGTYQPFQDLEDNGKSPIPPNAFDQVENLRNREVFAYSDDGAQTVAEIRSSNTAVDSYALTAISGGPSGAGHSGYVTLISNNGEAFVDESEPVQIQIIRVVPDLYRGFVLPVGALNPLAEQLTIQHTGDFAGRTQDYEFEWWYSPAVGASEPLLKPSATSNNGWLRYQAPNPQMPLVNRIVFGGGTQPLLTLTDNWVTMRYRRRGTNDWSEFPESSALAEGWIKRVLARINPFNQRINDFENNAVDVKTTLISQAGARWEGDIALTLQSAREAGLIEIYETLINRASRFSINGNPRVNYGPANDALLLASGYLNDLYMALGNEAFADASNPLIAIDSDPQRILEDQGLSANLGQQISETATSRFAFEGQVPSLIDEELVLLRGRDDFIVPGTSRRPVYNRFFWNYTRGIDAGEALYVVNYNIKEQSGPNADGVVGPEDAALQYPQGHGDAYGHYLTALTNYYRLLTNDFFTWTPRAEAVNVLSTPVAVDYFDERRMARAAGALARTSLQIIDLERRKVEVNTDDGWESFSDGRTNERTGMTRHWGLDEWGSRAAQGAYVHWLTVNALLPEKDEINEGIEKIDRTTVPELYEIPRTATSIQQALDRANNHANALGLTENSLLFDITPQDETQRETHFEQILARAKQALKNVQTSEDHARGSLKHLRSLENQADDYAFTINEQEVAFDIELVELLGEPYAGDVGPGRTYPQGYRGPDFNNFRYISRPYVYDRAELFPGSSDGRRTFSLPTRDASYLDFLNVSGSIPLQAPVAVASAPLAFAVLDKQTHTQGINDNSIYMIAPPELGRRPTIGRVQRDLAAVMAAEEDLFRQLVAIEKAEEQLRVRTVETAAILANKVLIDGIEFIDAGVIATADTAEAYLDALGEPILSAIQTSRGYGEAAGELVPDDINTFGGDVASSADGAVEAAGATAAAGFWSAEVIAETAQATVKSIKAASNFLTFLSVRVIDRNNEAIADVQAIRDGYLELLSHRQAIDIAAVELQRAIEEFQVTLADTETAIAQRESFRQRASAIVQGVRTRDVAFRAFRSEALERRDVLFEQAARYTYLAAKAYDYETGLLGTPAGKRFLAGIVETQSLGLLDPQNEPVLGGSVAGDPGLAGFLAQLEQDWAVAKGRLGINNPDQEGTTFSLRREMLRLAYRNDGTPEDHQSWQDRLRSFAVADLRADPSVSAHALRLDQSLLGPMPGFIIPFSTVIADGKNFFGQDLRPGDSTFSPSAFATKIHSVGVVLDGYKGMDYNCTCDFGTAPPPTHDHPDALSATPYVYLIPAGVDVMRVPPVDGESTLRFWNVHDHALPFPINLGQQDFAEDNQRLTSHRTLSESFFIPRKHPAFRAVDRKQFFIEDHSEEFTNSRLVGRSVWNTEWKIVIPAVGLLANTEEGMERFVNSVRDIQVYFKTYSHSGN